MQIRVRTTEPITVTITRHRQPNGGYGIPSHPGPAWRWVYMTTVPEIRLTPGNGLQPDDNRDLPWQMSETALGRMRKIVKQIAPNAQFVLDWDGPNQHRRPNA